MFCEVLQSRFNLQIRTLNYIYIWSFPDIILLIKKSDSKFTIFQNENVDEQTEEAEENIENEFETPEEEKPDASCKKIFYN